MRKKVCFLGLLMCVGFFALVACDGTDLNTKVEKKVSKKETGLWSIETKNDGQAIQGGTLKVGLVTDSPFQGVFSSELYEDRYDAEILQYASNSIFELKEDFLIGNEGLAKLDVDVPAKKATITIRKDVKWSDGHPFTIDDVIYPYYIIADKDYTGIRYDTDFQNIVGVVEYHKEKAKKITGIKKIDAYTMEISFKKISPSIYSIGNGLWGYAAPKHQLKNIKIKNLGKSNTVRQKPVTLGAFVIDKVVKGKSVQLVANKNYYKGRPKLDKVVIEAVPSASAAVAIKNGKYDMISGYKPNDYQAIKNFDNIDILGRDELAYTYLGFKLGKYDTKKGINRTNPKAKMGNINLRKAIVYAMNVEQVTKTYYDHLRTRANALLPPSFKTFYDGSLNGYQYDPEKAKQLLDEAGYKDINHDGYREDPKGKAFKIRFATMAGSDDEEKIDEFYIQNWKAVGLKVEYTTGHPIEFNNFYNKVQADDKNMDMFIAAWKIGSNPSPVGLYAKNAAFNFSRFASSDLTKLLKDIDSVAAMDRSYRSNAFAKWQEYMSEQATTVPIYFHTEIIPVNKRVKKFNIDHIHGTELQDIELIADEPIQSSQ